MIVVVEVTMVISGDNGGDNNGEDGGDNDCNSGGDDDCNSGGDEDADDDCNRCDDHVISVMILV